MAFSSPAAPPEPGTGRAGCPEPANDGVGKCRKKGFDIFFLPQTIIRGGWEMRWDQHRATKAAVFGGVSPRLRAFEWHEFVGLDPGSKSSGRGRMGGTPWAGLLAALVACVPRARSAGAGDAVGRLEHGHSGALGVPGSADSLPPLLRGCRSPALPPAPSPEPSPAPAPLLGFLPGADPASPVLRRARACPPCPTCPAAPN